MRAHIDEYREQCQRAPLAFSSEQSLLNHMMRITARYGVGNCQEHARYLGWMLRQVLPDTVQVVLGALGSHNPPQPGVHSICHDDHVFVWLVPVDGRGPESDKLVVDAWPATQRIPGLLKPLVRVEEHMSAKASALVEASWGMSRFPRVDSFFLRSPVVLKSLENNLRLYSSKDPCVKVWEEWVVVVGRGGGGFYLGTESGATRAVA